MTRHMTASIARWVLRHRRIVVLTWVVLTLAGGIGAGQASKAFKTEISGPGSEAFRANNEIARVYGNGGQGSVLVAVVTLPASTTVDSPGVHAQLVALGRRVSATLPGTREASFVSTGDRAFVSSDRRTTFALVYPRPDPGSYGQSPIAAKRLAQALGGTTVDGAPVHLTGLAALSNQAAGQKGTGVLVEALLGGLGALVVLGFVFGSLLAFVPLVMAVCSILTSFLLIWGVAEITSISNIVEFLIALVGLGVAIDYTLLIVVRWREERASGYAGEEAVVRAMSTAGRAVILSGTTVAIGLFALVAMPLPFLRSMGYGGLLIPVISVAVALTLLPIVLVRFGDRLDWPHRRSDQNASRAWSRWARVIVRHRWIAAIAAIAVLGALIVAAAGMNLGTEDPNALAKSGAAKTGLVELEHSGIGAGVLTPTEIITSQARADLVAAEAAHVPDMRGAVAPRGPSWQRGGTAVVDALSPYDGSTGTGRAVISPIRAGAHAADPAALVGGQVAGAEAFITAVYGSFPLMIAVIAATTFLLLARALRSLLLAAKAVALNVVSVTAAWGALTLIWQHGYGSKQIWGIAATGALPQWIPVIVFAFLFGLSMDYEVFILTRMRESYDTTHSTPQAVITGIGRTGRLVTSAALILFLSFVAMASGPSTDVKMLATGLGVGILLDATIIRALLVPALVSLFGHWNWWLPPLPARLLRVQPSLPSAAITASPDRNERADTPPPRAPLAQRDPMPPR
jgi:RND superfamily putative drug exporter